jgi:hypothetical protein
MRCALAGLLATLALCSPPTRAADAPAPDEPPPTYTTEVKGTVPDLIGRWFVVAQLSTPQGGQPVAAVASFWEVTAPEGKPALTVRFVSPPAAISDAIRAANTEHRPWEPSLEELRGVRDGWNTLRPEARGVASVETTITGKDAFTDPIKADDAMRDARFVVQTTTNFTPGNQRPIKDVLLYGAKEQETYGWRGAYASATIAAAPFPIPIAFAGTFHMYRLESVAPRGLLARVLSVFSGCGRKSSS